MKGKRLAYRNNTMDSKSTLFGIFALLLIVGAVVFFRGCESYGTVSDSAYQYSKAILLAASSENTDRLAAVSKKLNSDKGLPSDLTEQELSWLRRMVKLAEDGNWKQAASQARTLMKEQRGVKK